MQDKDLVPIWFGGNNWNHLRISLKLISEREMFRDWGVMKQNEFICLFSKYKYKLSTNERKE